MIGARAVRLVPRAKYGNHAVVIDGHRFASQREATRYGLLRLLEGAGQICNLELQPRYVLHVARQNVAGEIVSIAPVGSYVADFRYRTSTGEVVVEDSKGVRTAVYRLKRRMMAAEYGIQVQEV